MLVQLCKKKSKLNWWNKKTLPLKLDKLELLSQKML